MSKVSELQREQAPRRARTEPGVALAVMKSSGSEVRKTQVQILAEVTQQRRQLSHLDSSKLMGLLSRAVKRIK